MALLNDELLLVERIRKGDKKSYEQLFNKYIEALSYLSYRIVRNRELAEEVVQNFFVKVWLKREDLFISTSFRAYAFRSVYNSSLNELRSKSRFVPVDDCAQILVEESNVDNELIDEKTLQRAVDALPLQCRRIFTMVCIQGLSYAEVAEDMGLSINTVKVQMSKAYKQLRQSIPREVLMYAVIFLMT